MKGSKKRIRGVASIEFALGFMAFWMMCMFWGEVSYMSFVSAVTDITISEAARESKKSEQSYDKVFQNVINNSGSITFCESKGAAGSCGDGRVFDSGNCDGGSNSRGVIISVIHNPGDGAISSIWIIGCVVVGDRFESCLVIVFR